MDAKDVKKATQNVEAMVRKIEDNDNAITLKGIAYKFHRFRHKERVRVFGFLTSVTPLLEAGNFEFLTSDSFERVEKIISDNVTVDGMSLAKLVDHWEDNPQNYIPFFTIALQFVSYPLLKGDLTS